MQSRKSERCKFDNFHLGRENISDKKYKKNNQKYGDETSLEKRKDERENV